MAAPETAIPSEAVQMPPPITNETSNNGNGNNSDNNNTDQKDPQQSTAALVGTTCMELALEGERLCKTGDFKNGVRFFEEAIRVGTTDDRTLSAIYSQLGNAYFYLEDYQRALEYHKQDVTLVHSIGDETAEAKACGNLGNTFKMLGKFDEAAVYCRRYLEISRKLKDLVGEGRALYNLGNVYHTQGKRMIGSSEQEPGELSNDIKSSLQRAIDYYEENLKVVTGLNDQAAMGRAYGNLGNTHYLLGNFESAVESHKRRLELARKTGDRSAERRAHLNLGNANVFLGNFPEAIENYSATLGLAQELQDKYTEAHSCYSLANTYTFLRDYNSAITYHLKYLELIKELDDKLGEGRACWSLVNIYQMVNDADSALVYARRHYDIAEQLGDKAGLASAKLNIEELEETIAQKRAVQLSCGGSASGQSAQQNQLQPQPQQQQQQQQHRDAVAPLASTSVRLSPDKRQEQEQRRFKKQLNSNLATDIDGLATKRKGSRGPLGAGGERGAVRSSSSERLFDMIAHFQSGRIDDQRCEILNKPVPISSALSGAGAGTRNGADDKENLHKNDGRKGSDNNNVDSSTTSFGGANSAGRSFSRMSQPSIGIPLSAVSAAASAIKNTYRKASLVAYPTTANPLAASIQSQRRPTVSAEHREQLFDLIAGAQRQRMDEQRASLPALTLANGVLKNPTNAGLLARGHTVDQPASGSSNQRKLLAKGSQIDERPEESPERAHMREKSHSIVPQTTAASTMGQQQLPSAANNQDGSKLARMQKLSRHFKTVDSDSQVHEERFLDSLMKYQSTRFNDQRSEFPDRGSRAVSGLADRDSNNQTDNFLNLIVRFQSDRIDDQRSAPPPPKN